MMSNGEPVYPIIFQPNLDKRHMSKSNKRIENLNSKLGTVNFGDLLRSWSKNLPEISKRHCDWQLCGSNRWLRGWESPWALFGQESSPVDHEKWLFHTVTRRYYKYPCTPVSCSSWQQTRLWTGALGLSGQHVMRKVSQFRTLKHHWGSLQPSYFVRLAAQSIQTKASVGIATSSNLRAAGAVPVPLSVGSAAVMLWESLPLRGWMILVGDVQLIPKMRKSIWIIPGFENNELFETTTHFFWMWITDVNIDSNST